jgi:hypothetical protein
MTEEDSVEVERLLLYVSDARDRAAKTTSAVQRSGADQHIVDAVQDAYKQLDELHRSLKQRTFYAIPSDALTLRV